MNANNRHTFDIVVIGSGLGGLVSALLLAKSGKSVAVLEKNNQFGGNLQTFARDKKIIDTGVHYVGGLDEGQNLHRYFSYLGILSDLQWEQLDNNAFDKIYFNEKGQYYPQAQGYENFVNQLLVLFPEEKEALEKYIKTIQTYCDAFPMYRLDFENKYQSAFLEPSVQEVMDSITSNETLKAVLLGNNFLYALDYQNTPFYVHALTVNSYIESSWRCVKGGSQITKALVKQLKRHKVQLFKYQEVKTFITDENRIVSCETETDSFRAETFISNIDLKTTYGFLPENFQKKPSVKRVKSLKVTPSVFSVHIVLKPQTIPYFNHNIYHYDCLNEVKNYHNPVDENFPKQMVITTNPVCENQKFADVITIMTYMDFEAFSRWTASKSTVKKPQNRGEDYEAFKRDLAEKIIEKASIHFPSLRENMLRYYTSTPLTYRDYIGSENGTLYGFEKTAHRSHLTQIFPQTKIPNLFLTGQNVRMHGILGVTVSAFHLVKEFLGDKIFNDLLELSRNK